MVFFVCFISFVLYACSSFKGQGFYFYFHQSSSSKQSSRFLFFLSSKLKFHRSNFKVEDANKLFIQVVSWLHSFASAFHSLGHALLLMFFDLDHFKKKFLYGGVYMVMTLMVMVVIIF